MIKQYVSSYTRNQTIRCVPRLQRRSQTEATYNYKRRLNSYLGLIITTDGNTKTEIKKKKKKKKGGSGRGRYNTLSVSETLLHINMGLTAKRIRKNKQTTLIVGACKRQQRTEVLSEPDIKAHLKGLLASTSLRPLSCSGIVGTHEWLQK